MSGSGQPLFEAVIVPHRSLDRAGFWWLAAALLLLSAGVSAGLWLAGAWPAVGFAGLDVVLALWLIRRSVTGPAPSEMVILTESALRVVRTDRRGRRQERQLDTAWLRAKLEERPGRTPGLVLRNRVTATEIGMLLGEAEKRDLAEALHDALDRQRRPVFDNPQLREVSPPADPSI